MSSKPTGEKCEKCKEGLLVERVNSLNGFTFIGCSEWPVCTFTKRGGENPAYTYEDEVLEYEDYYSYVDMNDGPYGTGLQGWDD